MSRFVTAFERAEQEAGLRREAARETAAPPQTNPAPGAGPAPAGAAVAPAAGAPALTAPAAPAPAVDVAAVSVPVAADPRPAGTPVPETPPSQTQARPAGAPPVDGAAIEHVPADGKMPPLVHTAAVGDAPEPALIADIDSRRNGAPIMAPSKAPRRPKPPATRISEQLVSLLAPASFEAEQYRVLRHRVEQFNKAAGLSIVAVSSPTAADGKTTTAINLAGSLAQAPNARVLLLDADLRGPSVAYHLALEDREAPGLVEAILDDRLTLDAVVQAIAPLNLSVLPAGRRPAAPYEVLQSPRMGELMEAARVRYDFIIIDTPPLVSVPDCRVIGKWVDGFLVVVAAHKTTRKLLEEALRIPEPGKVLGLVFNGDDHHFSRDYYTYSLNGNGARWPRRKR
jgi:capsular exopolysaccharide synthesis family protein